MLTLSKLKEDLLQALVPAPSMQSACDRACEILRHYAANQVQLPERICQPDGGSYARHLIYRHESSGFCVVAMVWAPGQGTAIHDHGGTWCVEGCVQGQLAITSYRIHEHEKPQRVRFEQEDYVEVGCGSVGCLIPPFEHHRIHNPFDKVAITLHVYGEELLNCTRYLPESAESYRPEKVPLSYHSYPESLV